MKRVLCCSIVPFCILLSACGPAYIPNYTDITTRAASNLQRENSLQPHLRCESGVEQIDRVVLQLATASKTYNWCVHYKKGNWNASVDNKRNIIVNSGLLEDVESDSELAAVIGHEMAHAIFNHPEKSLAAKQSFNRMKQSIYRGSPDKGKAQLALALAGLLHGVLVEKPFNREQEYEADTLGLYLLMESDYEASDAIRIWYRQHQKQGGDGGTDFMSTHPLNRKRVVNFFRALASHYKSREIK